MRMTVLKGKNKFITKFKHFSISFLKLLFYIELKGEDEEISGDDSSFRSHGTTATKESRISLQSSSRTSSNGSVNQNASNPLQSEVEASTTAIDSNNALNPVQTEMEAAESPPVLMIAPKDSNPLQGERELLYDQDWKEPHIEVSEMTKQEKMIELIKRVCGKRIDKVYGNKILFYLFLRTCVMMKVVVNLNSMINYVTQLFLLYIPTNYL